MESALHLLHYLASFVIVISVIVFVHEFGHYFVARLCGVKVEVFSIGFGREIFGWNDRAGTRWKLSLWPLGGYVKMFGDASAASNPDFDAFAAMSEAEKKVSFHGAKLRHKAAIACAGPVANFLLTIGLMTYFLFTVGLPSTAPIIGEIMPDTPAQRDGLKVGDQVLQVGDTHVEKFQDIVFSLSTNLGTPVTLKLLRDGTPMQLTLTPQEISDDDGLGNKVKRFVIGIKSQQTKYEAVSLPEAVAEAVQRTYLLCTNTLHVLWQMVSGQRSTQDLKGPVGIAKLSGQATDQGVSKTLWLIALLSANLGLVNLLPVPMLDGGHLAYYAAEAARGRPLAQKVQEYGIRIGMAMVAMLMALTLYNDIVQLFS